MAVAEPQSPVEIEDPIDGSSAPTRRYRRVPAWIGPLAVGAVAAGACIYTLAVDPNTEAGVYPPCYFRQVTGLDCPGCGLTRSAHALLSGDPLRALNHNVLAAVLFPVMLYTYIAWTANSFGARLPMLRIKPWMGWVAMSVILGFWVIRNLPGPFEWLDSWA